jgi:hypothetical protein
MKSLASLLQFKHQNCYAMKKVILPMIYGHLVYLPTFCE